MCMYVLSVFGNRKLYKSECYTGRVNGYRLIGVFPKWNRNLVNSVNLINHWSMNWTQFKNPVSHMCLVGTVAASWFLAQEVAGSSPFTVMTNIFVTELKTLRENSINLISQNSEKNPRNIVSKSFCVNPSGEKVFGQIFWSSLWTPN